MCSSEVVEECIRRFQDTLLESLRRKKLLSENNSAIHTRLGRISSVERMYLLTRHVIEIKRWTWPEVKEAVSTDEPLQRRFISECTIVPNLWQSFLSPLFNLDTIERKTNNPDQPIKSTKWSTNQTNKLPEIETWHELRTRYVKCDVEYDQETEIWRDVTYLQSTGKITINLLKSQKAIPNL